MASYKIEWRKSTKKDLRKIPQNQVLKIIQAAESLAQKPHPKGSKKLVGSENSYRLRIGDYRLLYDVLEDHIVIEIFKIAHRKDSYR